MFSPIFFTSRDRNLGMQLKLQLPPSNPFRPHIWVGHNDGLFNLEYSIKFSFLKQLLRITSWNFLLFMICKLNFKNLTAETAERAEFLLYTYNYLSVVL
jgi:hypothetical protein